MEFVEVLPVLETKGVHFWSGGMQEILLVPGRILSAYGV